MEEELREEKQGHREDVEALQQQLVDERLVGWSFVRRSSNGTAYVRPILLHFFSAQTWFGAGDVVSARQRSALDRGTDNGR